VDSNSEIQGYNVYLMLHFHRKFSSGVTALLNSGTTGMFINREMAKKHSFKMMKLERPLKVKNVNGTENSCYRKVLMT